MKNLLLLLFIFISINSIAQKPKKEILFNSNLAGKIERMTSSGDKATKSTDLHLINRNDKYNGIYYSLTIYKGCPSQMLDFLTEIEKFSNEHTVGEQTKIHNRLVKYEKMFGYKAISVYDEKGEGFHAYRKKDITKLQKWLAGWLEENNNI